MVEDDVGFIGHTATTPLPAISPMAKDNMKPPPPPPASGGSFLDQIRRGSATLRLDTFVPTKQIAPKEEKDPLESLKSKITLRFKQLNPDDGNLAKNANKKSKLNKDDYISDEESAIAEEESKFDDSFD